MLILFWFILSLMATGVTSYFIGVNEWIEFWIPLLLLVGYFVAVAALYFAFAYIFGLLTIRKNKEYEKISKFHAFLFDITLAFLFHAGRAKIHVIGDE